jgi:hypothetical protein
LPQRFSLRLSSAADTGKRRPTPTRFKALTASLAIRSSRPGTVEMRRKWLGEPVNCDKFREIIKKHLPNFVNSREKPDICTN